jgi:hypothetical protein
MFVLLNICAFAIFAASASDLGSKSMVQVPSPNGPVLVDARCVDDVTGLFEPNFGDDDLDCDSEYGHLFIEGAK